MDPHSGIISPKLLFGILGNIIGVGVNLAPMPTFWRIYREKSTQGFSGLPYVFSLFSALLWVLYGLPMVTKNALMLITINVASGSIQIFYLTVFVIYAAKKARIHVIRVLAGCFAFLATAAVLTLTVVPQPKRAETVGCICVVIGAMTYASPLSVARMVILTRSVEFLPILLCVFFFINSCIWTLYGTFTMDIFVLIPNGLGVVCGVAQIALYVIYRNAKPLPTTEKVIEMPADKVADTSVLDLPTGKGGGATVIEVPTDTFVKSSAQTPDGKPTKIQCQVEIFIERF
ncbi:unnamed protein product [Calypogeia fissa]